MNYTECWQKFKTEAWYRWTTLFNDEIHYKTRWIEADKKSTCTAQVRVNDSLVIRGTMYCKQCHDQDELHTLGRVARYDGVYLDGLDIDGSKWSPGQQRIPFYKK